MAELLADAEPVGGCGPRHKASYGDPGTGGLAGEQVITTLLGTIENSAELALQEVDDRGQLLRIDKVEVGLTFEIVSGGLQPFESIAHVHILRNYVREIKR